MRKLLRTQDILLLGLSGILDLFEEARDPFSLVSKSYENMYGWVPKNYKRHNFTHLVWRSIKTGYIEKIEKEGEIYIRLTPQGNQKITRDFPLISFQNKKWDNRWRVAIFDIEEVNRRMRNSLRCKLRELGFGMLQKSVFISPHDILRDFSEFIKNLGLEQAVYVFETSKLGIGNTKELADKVWSLDLLNEKYKEIIEKGEDIKNKYLIKINDRRIILNNIEKEQLGKSLILLKNQYLETVFNDPFLPKELLPEDWWGDKAKRLIKNL